ncbi:MAG: alternative ribosome rescue aminoacyl-tRNA hydrolase ArfB [Gemmatimonadaceae bacterium]
MTPAPARALRVTDRVEIPADELIVRATRSGGPGGQHVNTSATRVELYWHLATSRALDDAMRERARARLGARVDGEGFVRVVASESRSQRQNRGAAERRLADLLRDALAVPKRRVATRPSAGAKERRLREKKKHGERKRLRRPLGPDE